MKIDSNALHQSKDVLELLDSLKEELLVLFSLDKYINAKNEEIDDMKRQLDEIDSLRLVYEKAQRLHDHQMQSQIKLQQQQQMMLNARQQAQSSQNQANGQAASQGGDQANQAG